MVPLYKGLQWVNFKKAIKTNLGIFRTLCYPDICKTVVYPEP